MRVKRDGRTDRLSCEIGEIRYNVYQGKLRGIRRRRIVVGNTRRVSQGVRSISEDNIDQEKDIN